MKIKIRFFLITPKINNRTDLIVGQVRGYLSNNQENKRSEH